jgi:hypothetical protein
MEGTNTAVIERCPATPILSRDELPYNESPLMLTIRCVCPAAGLSVHASAQRAI